MRRLEPRAAGGSRARRSRRERSSMPRSRERWDIRGKRRGGGLMGREGRVWRGRGWVVG